MDSVRGLYTNNKWIITASEDLTIKLFNKNKIQSN